MNPTSNANTPVRANILIVDDVPANLHVLSQMLSQAGYKARAGTDGELAIETAQCPIDPDQLAPLIQAKFGVPLRLGTHGY